MEGIHVVYEVPVWPALAKSQSRKTLPLLSEAFKVGLRKNIVGRRSPLYLQRTDFQCARLGFMAKRWLRASNIGPMYIDALPSRCVVSVVVADAMPYIGESRAIGCQ